MSGATYDPRSFDHLAEEYDFASSLERRPDFFLENLPERRGAVLDVGCGTGILAGELSKHFGTVVAVDISEPMLAIARARRGTANIEYRREDANRLEFTQTFDCIVSHTTFHHLEDVAGTLRRLASLLEPGGRLIVVDNVRRWPWIPRDALTMTAKACVKFPLNARRHGGRSARRLFRFYTSRPWLEHVATDDTFSRGRFCEVYGGALPGATFVPMSYFMGVVWEAKGE